MSRQEKFTQIAQQVKTIMEDAAQRAPYEASFALQRKYTQLRGYIFATLFHKN